MSVACGVRHVCERSPLKFQFPSLKPPSLIPEHINYGELINFVCLHVLCAFYRSCVGWIDQTFDLPFVKIIFTADPITCICWDIRFKPTAMSLTLSILTTQKLSNNTITISRFIFIIYEIFKEFSFLSRDYSVLRHVSYPSSKFISNSETILCVCACIKLLRTLLVSLKQSINGSFNSTKTNSHELCRKVVPNLVHTFNFYCKSVV